MIDDKQKEMLDKPLNPSRIKSRQQAGTNLSYIEGWDAIETANRIFGYDGWSNDVLAVQDIGTEEYVNSNGKKGWQVACRATVRVDALNTHHTDVGYGNGIDYKSALAAHEMAEKEAVTDALKRALKDFGNQFGLPLYDKKQAGVGEDPETAPAPAAEAPKPTAKQPATNSAAPTEATDARVNELYEMLKEMGKDPVWISGVFETTKQKYGGIIPAMWVENQLTRATLEMKKEES